MKKIILIFLLISAVLISGCIQQYTMSINSNDYYDTVLKEVSNWRNDSYLSYVTGVIDTDKMKSEYWLYYFYSPSINKALGIKITPGLIKNNVEIFGERLFDQKIRLSNDCITSSDAISIAESLNYGNATIVEMTLKNQTWNFRYIIGSRNSGSGLERVIVLNALTGEVISKSETILFPGT